MAFLHKVHSSEAGFTLIETFVAIGVLMIALLGPLTLAQQSLSSSTTTADQVTAFYLTQDVMEYIRNIRDSNIKSGEDWKNGFDPCYNGTPCRIDTSDNLTLGNAIQDCSGSSCELLLNASTDKYGYSAGNASQFRREIEMTVADSGREILVEVTIFWDTSKYTGNFTASQSIFNITS